jgi:hypothetical protein
MNYDSSKVVSGTNRVSRTEFNMALQKTSSAPAELTTEQRRLAEDLMRCHGNVKVSRETNGLHFLHCLSGMFGGRKRRDRALEDALGHERGQVSPRQFWRRAVHADR